MISPQNRTTIQYGEKPAPVSVRQLRSAGTRRPDLSLRAASQAHEWRFASMEKIRQMIAAYKATLFINHDKKQTDKLKLLPEFYD